METEYTLGSSFFMTACTLHNAEIPALGYHNKINGSSEITGVCKHPSRCDITTRHCVNIMTIIAIHYDSIYTNFGFLKTSL